MLRKLMLLPLALPVALFVGCGTTQNDPVASTDDALESCFSTSSDGSTKCAIQTGGFSSDPQDLDHDGRPDAFVCAHVIKVPHGSLGIGGASGTPPAPSTGALPPALPAVPANDDCDHLGCQDLRPHPATPVAGAGGVSGKPAPVTPPAADAAAATKPAGDDDMKCPDRGSQGGPMGPPGDQGAGGVGGVPTGHGTGDPGAGHGAGGAGAP